MLDLELVARRAQTWHDKAGWAPWLRQGVAVSVIFTATGHPEIGSIGAVSFR